MATNKTSKCTTNGVNSVKYKGKKKPVKKTPVRKKKYTAKKKK